MSHFYFGEDCYPIESKRVQVRVPAGINKKQRLVHVIDVGLGFPDYFGENWDALEECIRDLNWITSVQVIIIHEDIPLRSNPEQLKVYLSILHDAVAHWNKKKEHKLFVIFPAECEREVQQLISPL